MDMRTPGLMRRGAVYYLRVAVPLDLVRTIGRSQIWKSLRTADYQLATKRVRRERAELDRYFEQARKVKAASGRLGEAQARMLVLEWFRREDRAAAEADFKAVSEQREAIAYEARWNIAEAQDGLGEGTTTALAHKLLIAAGWPAMPHVVGKIQTKRVRIADVDQRSEEFASLCNLVRRALVEASRRRLDRLGGEPAQVRDPLFNGNGAVGVVHANGVTVHESGPDGLSVGEALERFRREKEPVVNDRKGAEYRSMAEMLCEIWGPDRPLSTVDRAACRKVRDLLQDLPPNSKKRFPKMTFKQAAAHARDKGLPPLDVGTATGYLARLSTFLNWCQREEFIARNPAVGLAGCGNGSSAEGVVLHASR